MNNLGSNRKRRKRASSVRSVHEVGSPGKNAVDIPIPSPIKLGVNQTPLKLGSLSPFFPRAFMGVSSEIPMKFESDGVKRSAMDSSIVHDDRLIQLLPAFDTASGYGMAIMDDHEGISDLFSPKHAFDPMESVSSILDEEVDDGMGEVDSKKTKTRKRKKKRT